MFVLAAAAAAFLAPACAFSSSTRGRPVASRVALGGAADRGSLEEADAWLDAAVQSTLDRGGFDESSFLVGVLGDLHIDPRKMEDYEEGK